MSSTQYGAQDPPQHLWAPAQETTDFNDRAGQSLQHGLQPQAPQVPVSHPGANLAPPVPGLHPDQAVNDGSTAIPYSQQQYQQQQQYPAQMDPQLAQAVPGWQQQQYADPAPMHYANQADGMQQRADNAGWQQQNVVEEDFLLMDVVGGGCANQSGRFGGRSVGLLHPTKPVVAYSAGCMIIVYDLMSDSKVDLIGHQHDVHALAFTPTGESLISVDFNRNAELQDNLNAQGGMGQESTSQVFLWDWQRGTCLQEAPIPRSQNLSMILSPQGAGMNAGLAQFQTQDRPDGIYSQAAGVAAANLHELPGGGAPSTCHIQVSIEKSGTMFMILESSPLEIGGGYRVTLWSFNKQQVMEMISSMDLELQCPCIDLTFLPRTQSDILSAQRSAGQSSHSAQVFLNSRIPFLTVEKQCVKLWEYSQGNAQLKKRIHIKQNISSLRISDLTNFFLILGESGKVLILDQQGEFVSTVSKEGVVFTTIGTAHDRLLLGTNRGTVHVYHIASLQFISEIPYQLSFLEKFSLNSFLQSTHEIEQLSLQKVGPPASSIGTTQNLRFLWIRYQDGSFVVIDRTIMNPRQAILGYSCGHFEAISGMQWVPPRSSIDLVSRPGGFANLNNQSNLGGLGGYLGQDAGFSGQGGAQATHDQQFVTCAHDLSIHLWRHYGDRWAFSYIDVAKSFDQALSFQRKQCDRSTRELKLTAVCLYPRSNNLVVGDSKGFVRVFQLVNENAHLIATYRLPRSQEVNAERAFGIGENPTAARLGGVGSIDDEFSNDHIKEIYITKNESTAVVTFQSGMISFYDTKNGYTWIGDAVDQDVLKFNTQQASGNFVAIQTKVIEVGDQNSFGGSTLGTSFKDRMQMYHQKLPPQQDERPAFSQSGPQGVHGSHTSSLKILSLQTPNQVAMQLVDVKGSKLTRSPLCQYVISEGKITGFDLHPSGDYLLVTSSKGRIYVFRIDTGELRGTIRIPLNASGCQVDPSGLYVAVRVPAFADLNAMNLASGGGASQLANQIGHFGANEKDLARNTILMYEVGTGMPAAEICSVFEISEMRFSCDGRFLALGSTSGAISVWSMGNHLHQNVKQVLDAMRLSNDFWFNYPIFLPDSEQFDQGPGDAPQQIPPEEVVYPAWFPPQAQGHQNQGVGNNPTQFYAEHQAQAPPDQNYQQFLRNDAPQDLGAQKREVVVQALPTAEDCPICEPPLVQAAGLPQYPQRGAGQVYHPQADQLQNQGSMKYWQAPPAQRQQPSLTAAGNEQRFMRRAVAGQARGAQAEQAHGQPPMGLPTPLQQRLSQQIGQIGGADLQAQQHEQMLLTSQRNFNTGLYQAHVGQAPQLPPPIQAQPPNHLRVPVAAGFYPPGKSARFGAGGSSGRAYGQQQPQWPQQWQPGPQVGASPGGGFRGPEQPGWASQKQRYFVPPNNAPIPPYMPVQAPPNQAAQRGPTGHAMVYNTAVDATDAVLNQQRAAATLLGNAQAVAGNNVDMIQPVPFNQSQLLYGQPPNAGAATIGGTEAMGKSRTFERYADLGAAGAVAGQAASRPQADAVQVPYITDQAQRGASDRNLNERATAVASSGRMMAGHDLGPAGTAATPDEQQRVVVSAEAPATQLQTYEPSVRDQVRNQQESNAQPAGQALSPASQDLSNPVSQARQFGSPGGQMGSVSGTDAGLANPTRKPGPASSSRAQLLDADAKKDGTGEFKPAGFSNTLTQQDILQGRAGLRPDPEDIDGGPQDAGKRGGRAQISGGAQEGPMAARMVQELEGVNNYMEGVRMPNALGGPRQAFTLKSMRQDEGQADPRQQAQRPRVTQLYAARPSAAPEQAQWMQNRGVGGAGLAARPSLSAQSRVLQAPGAGSEAGYPPQAKSSTRDVVDEMYQSIDDFEEKLAGRRAAQ